MARVLIPYFTLVTLSLPKKYEQNYNTTEPAPLGIEPNMIYIETQQTYLTYGFSRVMSESFRT